MWVNRIQTYGRLIKFSHTIFALPFALAAVMFAHRQHPVTLTNLILILLAMAFARSAAMGFNRYADQHFDAMNPRTAGRPHTTGQIDRRSILTFVTASSLLFILTAALLGRLCLALSLPVLFVLFFYSYTKRFTSLSHLVLGFAIGLAPIGAWIAATGGFDPRILLLSCALMTYIAGFDILYACQDIEFDRKACLFSIPADWGIHSALRFSSLLHSITFCSFVSLYFAFEMGRIYLLFLLLITILLVIEHRLVQPDRIERVNFAFFHVNGAISILLFLGVLTGVSF